MIATVYGLELQGRRAVNVTGFEHLIKGESMKSIAMPALMILVAMTAPIVATMAEERDQEPICLLQSQSTKVERTSSVS